MNQISEKIEKYLSETNENKKWRKTNHKGRGTRWTNYDKIEDLKRNEPVSNRIQVTDTGNDNLHVFHNKDGKRIHDDVMHYSKIPDYLKKHGVDVS